MFERLRRLRSDAREELDSAIGGRMIREVIEAKKQILAEETFAIRIGTAIILAKSIMAKAILNIGNVPPATNKNFNLSPHLPILRFFKF